MAKKIAVLGDRESVLGYRTLGFVCRCASDAESAERELKALAKEDFAVIYITEQLACLIPDTIAGYKDCPLPAIILIPGKEGSLGIGMKGVHDAVERAVGADILG
ncbi:MAG: V-type ATP synthase subunit F [Oscillospiraceae bacterium]|nr:V-type ATP synthase subunit F [Oscillospiraceae bacterium]